MFVPAKRIYLRLFCAYMGSTYLSFRCIPVDEKRPFGNFRFRISRLHFFLRQPRNPINSVLTHVDVLRRRDLRRDNNGDSFSDVLNKQCHPCYALQIPLFAIKKSNLSICAAYYAIRFGEKYECMLLCGN